MSKGADFSKRFLSILHNDEDYKIRIRYKPRFRDDMEGVQQLSFVLEIAESSGDMNFMWPVLYCLTVQNEKLRKSAEKTFKEVCSREFDKIGEKKFIKALEEQIKEINKVPGASGTPAAKEITDILHQILKQMKK